MCFDLDSRPPIAPIAGGALDSARLTLTADDGTRLAAFRARAANPGGAAILILPDVRGLHPYYEELALRCAEHGVDALAIDYFGRTAAAEPRPDGFEYAPHVQQATWAGLQADIRAGVERLRSDAAETGAGGDEGPALFSIGFCFGGRLAFLAATLGLGFRGVIGYYGRPLGEHPTGMPAPADLASSMAGSVLAIFGGADQGIPAGDVAVFEGALVAENVDHRVVTYDGAPHSFFDRKAADFAEASAAAWSETLTFIRDRTGAPA
jgi:carboxymethylenebutenolidase